MAEWFDTNASAIIAASAALLAAIIAALAAFGGALINNSSSKALREGQFKTEQWKANRELYLNKAEELFTLFDKWHDNAHQVMLLQTFRALGTKTREQVLEEWDEFDNRTMQPRIKALIYLYFPILADRFEEITKIITEVNLKYAVFISDDEEKANFIILSQKKATELFPLASQFRTELAKLTQKHI